MTGTEPTGLDFLEDAFRVKDPDGSKWAKIDAKRRPAAPVGPAPDPSRLPDDETRLKRARAWLNAVPGAVDGAGGSAATFAAACGLVHGFCLSPEVAFDLLWESYNPRCVGRWSQQELSRKVDQAVTTPHDQPRGYLLARGHHSAPHPNRGRGEAGGQPAAEGTAPAQLAPENYERPDDPHRIARTILRAYHDERGPRLVRWKGDFYAWQEPVNLWLLREADEFQGDVTRATRRHFEVLLAEAIREAALDPDKGTPQIGKTTPALVASVTNALASEVQVGAAEVPAWINGGSGPNPANIVPVRNGLLDLEAVAAGRPDALIPPTPKFFGHYAAAFDYRADAPEPAGWLAFLQSVWEGDAEPVALLQEFMGYLLTPDTSLQKALLMIGPPRSGKGTILRAIRDLVGPANCCAPAMSSLADRFGLASAVGKSVAIMPDVRITARTDLSAVNDRFLSITGENEVDIDRKNRTPLAAFKLKIRFVMATNEAPRIPDASGAFASRLCILPFTRGFEGKEDPGLDARLAAELPGILLWAIRGWARLRQTRRFTAVRAADSHRESIKEVGSPVGAFLEERCDVGPAFSCPCLDLFGQWIDWNEEHGRKDAGNSASFGVSLKSALPGLRKRRLGSDRDGRTQVYEGVRLKPLYDREAGGTGRLPAAAAFTAGRHGTSQPSSHSETGEVDL